MITNLSVIIATYNSEKTLAKALNSLLIQTYNEFEVIIIDGLSIDKTVSIVKEFERKFSEKNIPLIWISEKDAGIYDAWNKGVQLSNSSWIAFLGSDDTYYPDALENYAYEIQQNPGINYICSKVEYIDKNGKVLKVIGKAYNVFQMNRYMTVAHVGSFHHRELFISNGYFDVNYKIVGDYDFFLRSKNNIKPSFINQITAQMLNEGVSNNTTKVLKDTLQLQLKHQTMSNIRCYLEYCLSYLKFFVRRFV